MTIQSLLPVLLLSVTLVADPAGAAAGLRPRLRWCSEGPRGGSCNENCDRKAADCLDLCDAKHKEDKPRVECKLKCATERQKCESGCGGNP